MEVFYCLNYIFRIIFWSKNIYWFIRNIKIDVKYSLIYVIVSSCII